MPVIDYMKNAQNGLTILGFNKDYFEKNKMWVGGFEEWFLLEAWMILRDDFDEANTLIEEALKFEEAGCIYNYENNRNKVAAAYQFVLMDRLNKAAYDDDGWAAAQLLLEIYEVLSIIDPIFNKASINARNAALKRHEENHSLKNDLLNWYTQNNEAYKSMDAMAQDAIKQVPVAFRTARSWIAQFKKNIPSAR
jgi:hypothetical protein